LRDELKQKFGPGVQSIPFHLPSTHHKLPFLPLLNIQPLVNIQSFEV